LVLYFRRRGFRHPEDLAQNTLLALYKRSDFEFAGDDDFLKICYAFARNVAQEGRREARRDVGFIGREATASVARSGSLREIEMPVFLNEVLRAGERFLKEEEWAAIRSGVESEKTPLRPGGESAAGRLRVLRHRARNKLAELTGWRRPGKAGRTPGPGHER